MSTALSYIMLHRLRYGSFFDMGTLVQNEESDRGMVGQSEESE